MNLLCDAYADWVDDVINGTPPPPTVDDATDIVQLKAPTLSQQDGNDWWDAVAAEYFRLGITAAAPYVNLRTEVTNSGASVSNELFEALQSAIFALPETPVVFAALTLESLKQEETQIPLDITTIETDRDLQTDQVLIDAYNQGIAALNERLGLVQAEIAALGG